jgi:hypothetical protein
MTGRSTFGSLAWPRVSLRRGQLVGAAGFDAGPLGDGGVRSYARPQGSLRGGLFAPENLDATVAALLDSQAGGGIAQVTVARDAVQARLDDAETRRRSYGVVGPVG